MFQEQQQECRIIVHSSIKAARRCMPVVILGIAWRFDVADSWTLGIYKEGSNWTFCVKQEGGGAFRQNFPYISS